MQTQIDRIEANVTRLHADIERLQEKVESLKRPLISLDDVLFAAYLTALLIFVFFEPRAALS